MNKEELVILSIYLSGDSPTHNFQAAGKLPNDIMELAKWEITLNPVSLFPSIEFADPQGKGAVHLQMLRRLRDTPQTSGDQLKIWAPSYIFLLPDGKPAHKKDPVETLIRDDWIPEGTGTPVAAFPSKGIVYMIHALVRTIPKP
ncbi:MAG: hypothetical protein SGI77_28415 [Pirellulaceae bacterium]|nr:hypothetical protein [Pirellulaceae bacterium]